jgi:hypothetical protein
MFGAPFGALDTFISLGVESSIVYPAVPSNVGVG